MTLFLQSKFSDLLVIYRYSLSKWIIYLWSYSIFKSNRVKLNCFVDVLCAKYFIKIMIAKPSIDLFVGRRWFSGGTFAIHLLHADKVPFWSDLSLPPCLHDREFWYGQQLYVVTAVYNLIHGCILKLYALWTNWWPGGCPWIALSLGPWIVLVALWLDHQDPSRLPLLWVTMDGHQLGKKPST